MILTLLCNELLNLPWFGCLLKKLFLSWKLLGANENH